MTMLIPFLFLTFTISISSSDSIAVDLRKMTIDQIEKMPKSQRDMLPAVDLMRHPELLEVSPELRERVAFLTIQIFLSDLKYYSGYPTGKSNDALTAAIKRFQTAIGAQETGVLKWGEMELLMEKHDSIVPQKQLGLPPKRVEVSGDQVRAFGTWVFENDSQAFPLQTSKIVCSRLSMECTSIYAEIGFSNHLNISEETFKVTNWTEREIWAESTENDNEWRCVGYTLQINLTQKEATLFRRVLGRSGKHCAGFDQATAKILHLEDGHKVASDHYRRLREKSFEAYEPGYGSALKELFDRFDKSAKSTQDKR